MPESIVELGIRETAKRVSDTRPGGVVDFPTSYSRVPVPIGKMLSSCVEYVKFHLEDGDLSRIVRQVVSEVDDLYERCYASASKNCRASAVAKMHHLPLYQVNGEQADGAILNLSPSAYLDDPGFKPNGPRTSLQFRPQDREKLSKIREIYSLPSEAATIAHVLFIKNALLRIQKEHSLYTALDFPTMKVAKNE